MTKHDDLDWRDELRLSFESGEERCHAGCGDRATVLRLAGKWMGAFCRGCWSEIAWGTIPRLDPPRGSRRRGAVRR